MLSPNPVQPLDTADPVNATDRAVVASTNVRTTLPLNLANGKSLDSVIAEELRWFHQHMLETGLSFPEAGHALNYGGTTICRALNGTYEGNYDRISAAIRSYRQILAARAGIQPGTFAENRISQLIWSGLDYALANQSITLITGASGQGKTMACTAWCEAYNPGRSVLIEASPIGGAQSLLRLLCAAVGANKNLAQDQQLEAVLRAFNPHRMLIVDEARRLLPAATRGEVNPEKLEIIRYIHDRTRCGVALIATPRFEDTLKKLYYQFEEVLGRIDQPVRLFRIMTGPDVRPLLTQYIPAPSAKLEAVCLALVNDEVGGRLRILGKLLEVASKFASSAHRPVTEEDFFKALALRRQMMGETQHANGSAA